jgi:hypothetical protein
VISLVALVVALGGTSYAALTITGKNVKNGSLTTKDIKNNSLTSADVRDRSLRRRDFRSGELSNAQRGPAGPAGPAGAAGAAGSAIAFARVAASGVVDPGVSKNIAVVASPAGDGLYCLNDTAGTPKNIALTRAFPKSPRVRTLRTWTSSLASSCLRRAGRGFTRRRRCCSASRVSHRPPRASSSSSLCPWA